MLKKAISFLVLGVLLGAPNSFSADAVLLCKSSYQTQIDQIQDLLDQVEQDYHTYRWTEFKIRHLYYEYLWKARRQMQDPLVKSKRLRGREEEKYLMKALKRYEKISEEASSGMIHGLNALIGSNNVVAGVCQQVDYQECVRNAFVGFYAHMEDIKYKFSRIFENERSFRTNVAQTAAGKQGFYPEEALESSDAHLDFYNRFEAPQETKHFEEDREMLDYFHLAHKMLQWDFEADQCCYRCQKVENE